MTRLFLCLASVLLPQLVFSQDIEFHKNGLIVSGQVFTIDSSASAEYAQTQFYLVNTTDQPILFSWSRTRDFQVNGYTDQMDDYLNCFNADDITVFHRPETVFLNAGDSSVFNIKIHPHNESGCVLYTYKVFLGMSDVQDSVQIKCRFGDQNCELGIAEESTFIYSIYPNPASTCVYVNTQASGDAILLRVHNILGELTYENYLTDGGTIVYLDSMEEGVYFISFTKNGDLIETKRIVISRQ